MNLAKPLKIRSLQLMLDLVAENGPVISRQDCQLVEHGEKMQWVPSNQIKSYRTTVDTTDVMQGIHTFHSKENRAVSAGTLLSGTELLMGKLVRE
jgi:hypothetical protein